MLWTPISQIMNVVNGGPESVKEYLDAEKQKHENRIRHLMDDMKQSIGVDK